jgi:hypothetical protein
MLIRRAKCVFVCVARLKQIESEQQGLGLRLAPIAQPVEFWNSVVAADDNLASIRHASDGNRGGNRRIAASPIESAAREQPHASAIAPRPKTEAIKFYFVEPIGARRASVLGWESRTRATQQHAP